MQKNVCVAETKPPPTYIQRQPLPPLSPNICTEIHRDKQFPFRHCLVTAWFFYWNTDSQCQVATKQCQKISGKEMRTKQNHSMPPYESMGAHILNTISLAAVSQKTYRITGKDTEQVIGRSKARDALLPKRDWTEWDRLAWRGGKERLSKVWGNHEGVMNWVKRYSSNEIVR